MDLHQLSFGKIILLGDDLAEVIVDEGVEMDIEMVEEYHDWILNNLTAPCMLLINKINSYSYTFEAQRNLATPKEIKAMAVVSYTRISKKATKALSSLPRDVKWNIKIFGNREDALAWLNSQR